MTFNNKTKVLVASHFKDVFLNMLLRSPEQGHSLHWSWMDATFYSGRALCAYRELSIKQHCLFRLPKNYSEEALETVKALWLQSREFKFSETLGKPTRIDFEAYASAYSYLNRLFQNESFDCCFFWNGTSFTDVLVRELCRKYSVRTYFIEAGYFRPATTIVDPLGVNYSGILPQNLALLSTFSGDSHPAPVSSSGSMAWKMLYFIFRVLDRSTSVSRICSLKVYDNLPLIARLNLRLGKISKKLQSPGYRIFLPLQLEYDSQVLFHSPLIKSMEQAIEVVSRAAQIASDSLGNAVEVVVKPHPHQSIGKWPKISNVTYDRHSKTSELINFCDCIVTINSTVGIEAIDQGKSVVTLGNAVYGVNDVSIVVRSLDELAPKLINALTSKPNLERRKEFMSALKNSYLAHFNPFIFARQSADFLWLRVFQYWDGHLLSPNQKE